ncbi:MAG: hypothetical protein Q9181_002716 [Wetmoreana brouardii]
MAPEMSTSGPGITGDDLDDLFDYNVNVEEVFRDVDVSMTTNNEKEVAQTKSKDENLGLGIDEEIRVVKKRQPVARLDEKRLLSQAGVPKLRRLAKDRFRFKGKGHELWLDDLYPRAKFADGLAIIVKLGHTKRMQTMRREWINEGKSREKYDDRAIPQQTQEAPAAGKELREQQSAANNHQTPTVSDIHHSPAFSDEDLYSASPRQPQERMREETFRDSTDTLFLPDDDADDHPAEDDLDALLAEADVDNEKESNTTPKKLSKQKYRSPGRRDSFDDEMKAMAEMEDIG